jgi:hypothetical protein
MAEIYHWLQANQFFKGIDKTPPPPSGTAMTMSYTLKGEPAIELYAGYDYIDYSPVQTLAIPQLTLINKQNQPDQRIKDLLNEYDHCNVHENQN